MSGNNISHPDSPNVHQEKKVLVLVGPTASGKTSVSLNLAKQLHGEIVSADSRQVYRFMNIGTAKPSKEELQQVRHHFIDILLPNQDYNASEYSKQARRVIDEIFVRGNLPIVVGGSGLYIKALVDGFFEIDSTNNQVRSRLNERLLKEGAEVLLKELQKVDPLAATSMVSGNKKRIVRALEAFYVSGIPISQLQKKNVAANFTPYFVGLTWERKLLYERINRRVDAMVEEGLIDEVKELYKLGYSSELNSLQTVGYKEVFEHILTGLPREQMIELIKRNSRRYAKRQFTWFRADTRIKWFETGNESDLLQVSDEITKHFQNQSF
ncbi:MAG: tRNA (adenosine(37)-N6)-dimethylallyltransferase MiaA [Ignavibacteriae bacterium]|nr:tRNA (adenosine(37)-N6)-dimethylallyltransferase MiaA [Ignavibacteriota bacterium]